MDLRSGPINYARSKPARAAPKKRRPSPWILAVIGAALVVHAAAGLNVLVPEPAPETVAEQAIVTIDASAQATLALAPDLEILETELAALRQQVSLLTAAFPQQAVPAMETTAALRRGLAPLPDDLRPAIALIIDDVGLSTSRTRAVIDLPGSVTLSFLPYGERVQSLVREATWAGHEIFLHLPMEPLGEADPGPDALVTDLDRAELAARTFEALNAFEGYTGVNNHMGSRLTQDAGLMAEVMTHISARGVDFVDSLTSQQSVAYGVARAHGIRSAKRDVFIDHTVDAAEIDRWLRETVRIAQANGTAIAIAHPHAATLEALRVWLVQLESMGIDVVPVSEIIRRRNNEGMLVAAN